jgi:hypothetical protein
MREETDTVPIDLATTEDPEPMYAQMRPDVRTAIGEEFIRVFRLTGDPVIQRMAEEAAATFSVPQSMLSAAQVAAMHRHARQHHPALFAEVMRHPVTVYAQALLSGSPRGRSDQRDRGHRNRSESGSSHGRSAA